jgi:type-F conjugative transfer system secretin TraK
MTYKNTHKSKLNTGFLHSLKAVTCSLIPVVCFLMPEVHGAQVYPLNDLKAIQAEISHQGLTRIKVQDNRIRHVFGVTGEYVLETDEEQGQIFIRPMTPGPVNPISLTLTTEHGRTQDLLLTPTDKTPEALILQVNELPEKQQAPSSFPSRGNIEDLIQACREGRIPVGYRLMPLDLKTGHHKGLNPEGLSPTHHLSRGISNGSLRGVTYEVRNISEKPLLLREEEFAQDPQTIAVFLTKRTLNPGERTHVHVVAKTHP